VVPPNGGGHSENPPPPRREVCGTAWNYQAPRSIPSLLIRSGLEVDPNGDSECDDQEGKDEFQKAEGREDGVEVLHPPDPAGVFEDGEMSYDQDEGQVAESQQKSPVFRAQHGHGCPIGNECQKAQQQQCRPPQENRQHIVEKPFRIGKVIGKQEDRGDNVNNCKGKSCQSEIFSVEYLVIGEVPEVAQTTEGQGQSDEDQGSRGKDFIGNIQIVIPAPQREVDTPQGKDDDAEQEGVPPLFASRRGWELLSLLFEVLFDVHREGL